MFNEYLHPEMQALYRIEHLIGGEEAIGIMINTKNPAEIVRKLEHVG